MAINVNEVKLGVIGCGKMASAILSGLVNNKFIKNENIFVFDVQKQTQDELIKKFNFNPCTSIDEVAKKTNTLLLAVKPFVINDVLNEIKNDYNNHLVMSILAGVKLEKYNSVIENCKIVRIMPNTPALLNFGMSAICKSSNVSDDDFEFVFDFMKNCGEVIKTTEDKMDIITALSGSGPAFYFKFIELMANSANKLGLDENQALLLSAQTALGSAKMVLENNFNIEQLIKNVTTPGGCTEVGNKVLLDSNIESIFDKLIKDTMNKAIELG